VAVGVAVDRRVWCRVELGGDGVHLESKDTLQKASAPSVATLSASGVLARVGQVLQALEVESGVRVVTRSPVPESAGLGTGPATMVAVAAAVRAAQGRVAEPGRLFSLLCDAEARRPEDASGLRGFPPALRGGTRALLLESGAIREEALAVDPARVEECLLLVDSGGGGATSGHGEAVTDRIDGDDAVRRTLETLAEVARATREALVEGRFEEVADLFAAEWTARRRLMPQATTPEIDRVVEVARGAGGGARPCGTGRGSVVAVWAPPGARGPGRREAAEKALSDAGFRTFPARVDLRGLEVLQGL
jgi:galactokinase/mevalonate kinase-like predicted kinase